MFRYSYVHLNINLPLNQSFHKFPDRSDWVAPDLAYNCIIFLCSSKRDGSSYQNAGLHKLWYPSIRDTSTWSKLGAHGEHGDVFLFSNLGALWFSENRALVLGEFDIWIKIFIVCLFKGSQKQSFFLQTLLFTAFLVTVLKMLTYALVSTWSLVSSG